MRKIYKSFNEYLRGVFDTYVRNLVIENSCCLCGSKDKLHVHHDSISHKQLSEECVEQLLGANANYLDVTFRQMQILEDIYISRSLTEVKYKTLCEDCHKQLHHEKGNRKETYGNDGKNLKDVICTLKSLGFVETSLYLQERGKQLEEENAQLRKKIEQLEENKVHYEGVIQNNHYKLTESILIGKYILVVNDGILIFNIEDYYSIKFPNYKPKLFEDLNDVQKKIIITKLQPKKTEDTIDFCSKLSSLKKGIDKNRCQFTISHKERNIFDVE